MLDRLRSWFTDSGGQEPAHRQECVKRAVSLLLVSAARADGEFAADEAREIARLVSGHFDLPGDETAELVAVAAAQGSGDLYPTTRFLTEHLDRDERREVLLLMWRVVLSDGRLEPREESLMKRAARLLDIPHRDLIALKLKASQDPAKS